MSEIVIIHSQNDGLYHLCYSQPDSSTFYSFQKFVSKDLAEITAWKLNRDRQRKAG